MQLYSVKDYAELKGVTERSVRRWIQDEKVKAHKNEKGEWLIEYEGEELSLTPVEINDMRLLNQQMTSLWHSGVRKCPSFRGSGNDTYCTLICGDKGYETAARCKKLFPYNEPVKIGNRFFPGTDTFMCGPCSLDSRVMKLEKQMKRLFQPQKRQS